MASVVKSPITPGSAIGQFVVPMVVLLFAYSFLPKAGFTTLAAATLLIDVVMVFLIALGAVKVKRHYAWAVLEDPVLTFSYVASVVIISVVAHYWVAMGLAIAYGLVALAAYVFLYE